MTRRETVDVDGVPISYLTAGAGGPLVLLLHGTYWSRVWQQVLDRIAAAGLRPVAVDFPGFGRSGGELTLRALPASGIRQSPPRRRAMMFSRRAACLS